MRKWINKSKTHAKHIYVSVDVNLMEENLIWNKNRKLIRANVSVKNKWNVARVKWTMSGIVVHMLVNAKHCEIDEYLKDCKCIKSLAYGVVVTCDESEHISESRGINPSNRINCWPVTVVLLARNFCRV